LTEPITPNPFYLGTIIVSRPTQRMGVRVEPLGGDKMNYNNSKSTSESTKNNSQQNSTFNANGTAGIVTWSKEELEILQQCHEEKIASKVSYNSMPKHHKPSCNCTVCN
jgi:hypothetical protein